MLQGTCNALGCDKGCLGDIGQSFGLEKRKRAEAENVTFAENFALLFCYIPASFCFFRHFCCVLIKSHIQNKVSAQIIPACYRKDP